MAVDKLVDSTILDACCTAEANAIRAKTGDSAQIAYDFANSKGFADAIAAIPSGGGETYVGQITTDPTASSNRGQIDISSLGNGIFRLTATPEIAISSSGNAVTELYFCRKYQSVSSIYLTYGIQRRNRPTDAEYIVKFQTNTDSASAVNAWRYVRPDGTAITYDVYKIADIGW